MKHIYIASDLQNGGVAHYYERDGEAVFENIYPCERPAYLAFDGRLLHVLLREPFRAQSGVITFEIASDGRLSRLTEVIPTRGAIASHIIAQGGRVYVANYITGTTIALTDKMLVHTAMPTRDLGNPSRQENSHPHCLTTTPDGNILITDLGCDAIYTVTPELEPISETKFPLGSGPRHSVFSSCGRHVFTANELNSTVTLSSYENGRLEILSHSSTLPDGYVGENAPAAIRVGSNGRVYVSNRGHDSICELRHDGNRLIRERFIDTHGNTPRDFIIDGERILAANEDSDCVNIISLDRAEILDSIRIERPLAIMAIEI